VQLALHVELERAGRTLEAKAEPKLEKKRPQENEDKINKTKTVSAAFALLANFACFSFLSPLRVPLSSMLSA